jgi:hypothetical protein
MAQINLLITVKGAASAEEAERLAMRLLRATKAVKTVLEAAGHRITAKAAMPCECCGELADVRVGLCADCAGDVAVDRVLDHPGRVPLPMQIAEAAVM